MRRLRLVLLPTLLACLVVAVGCSEPPLIPVSGKITVNKDPLKKGEVTFHPDVEGGNKQKYADCPRGKLNESGEYTLSTGGKPGAPAGKYKVVINPNASSGSAEGTPDYAVPKDVIEKASTSETTTFLRAEVKANAP